MNMGGNQTKQDPSEFLLKLSLILGGSLIIVGYAAIFAAPDTALWFCVVIGFLMLVNPSNVFAILTDRLPRQIPLWLVVGSLILFDSTSFLLGVNRVFWIVTMLSLILPIYVCGRVVRFVFRLNPDLGIEGD